MILRRRRHGEGTLTLADGSKYSGQFKAGQAMASSNEVTSNSSHCWECRRLGLNSSYCAKPQDEFMTICLILLIRVPVPASMVVSMRSPGFGVNNPFPK